MELVKSVRIFLEKPFMRPVANTAIFLRPTSAQRPSNTNSTHAIALSKQPLMGDKREGALTEYRKRGRNSSNISLKRQQIASRLERYTMKVCTHVSCMRSTKVSVKVSSSPFVTNTKCAPPSKQTSTVAVSRAGEH